VIVCPSCGAPSTVIETRGNRRRRICDVVVCGRKFSTLELPVPDGRSPIDPVLVPRDLVEQIARSGR
jgi:hypothetical protein